MVGMVGAPSVWARVGGCLELEFRDLEGLDGLDTRFNTPWRLFFRIVFLFPCILKDK